MAQDHRSGDRLCQRGVRLTLFMQAEQG